MNRRSLVLGLGVMLACGAFLSAGCSEQGASNIPEERVITKESSDDMMKKMEEGRKGMGGPKGAPKK